MGTDIRQGIQWQYHPLSFLTNLDEVLLLLKEQKNNKVNAQTFVRILTKVQLIKKKNLPKSQEYHMKRFYIFQKFGRS